MFSIKRTFFVFADESWPSAPSAGVQAGASASAEYESASSSLSGSSTW